MTTWFISQCSTTEPRRPGSPAALECPYKQGFHCLNNSITITLVWAGEASLVHIDRLCSCSTLTARRLMSTRCWGQAVWGCGEQALRDLAKDLLGCLWPSVLALCHLDWSPTNCSVHVQVGRCAEEAMPTPSSSSSSFGVY